MRQARGIEFSPKFTRTDLVDEYAPTDVKPIPPKDRPTVPGMKRKMPVAPASESDLRGISLAKEDILYPPLESAPSPELLNVFGPPLLEKRERDTAPLKQEELTRLNDQLSHAIDVMPHIVELRLPPADRVLAERRWLELQTVVINALTGLAGVMGAGYLTHALDHRALVAARAERDQAVAALNDLREQFIRPPVLDTATQEQRDAKIVIEKAADRLFSTIFNEHVTPASIASAIETMASELDNDAAYTQAMPHKESVSQIRVALARRLFEDRQITPEEREHRLAMVDAGIRSPHVSSAYLAARERGPDAITDLFVRTSQEVGVDGPVARATLVNLLNGQTELPAITIEKLSHIPSVHRPLVLGLLNQQRTNLSALSALDETLRHSDNRYSKIERGLIIEQRERLEQESLRITHLIGQLVIQIHLPTEFAL